MLGLAVTAQRIMTHVHHAGMGGSGLSKNTFDYKGRVIEVVSIELVGQQGHGFGLKIDGATINRSGYDPLKSNEAAIAEGVRWAKDYIDSLP
ncbi:hypothetical protein H0A65_01000 [Alcaligenaceae bacterium]|nr:hypothetical protein [Alcaligenaceae bacterium]